ncbi:hypothetical protein EJB05_15247, partial [Eragrostis curvula]
MWVLLTLREANRAQANRTLLPPFDSTLLMLSEVWELPVQDDILDTGPEWLLGLLIKYPADVMAHFVMLLWRVWNVRNGALKAGEKISTEGSVIFLTRYMDGLLSARQRYYAREGKGKAQVVTLSEPSSIQKTKEDRRWVPPIRGKLKINVDGTYNNQTRAAGIGVVIRDAGGQPLLMAWRKLFHCRDAEEAEAAACLDGVRLATRWPGVSMVLESDAALVVSKLKTDDCDRSLIAGLISDIREECRQLAEFRDAPSNDELHLSVFDNLDLSRALKANFSGFGTVTEIDPRCQSGYDFSALRILVEVHDRAHVPGDVWITAPAASAAKPATRPPTRQATRTRGSSSRTHRLPSHHPRPPCSPPSGHQQHAAILSQLVALFGRAAPAVDYLPPLPTLVIIICHATLQLPQWNNTLALPWHATTTDTPEPLSPPPPCSPPTTTPRAPSPAPPRRRGKRAPAIPTTKRHSERLAAKEPAHFIDMTTKAVQLTALRKALASCSKELQKHVTKKGLLGRKKRAINTKDLKNLAHTAGLGDTAESKLDSVPSLKER